MLSLAMLSPSVAFAQPTLLPSSFVRVHADNHFGVAKQHDVFPPFGGSTFGDTITDTEVGTAATPSRCLSGPGPSNEAGLNAHASRLPGVSPRRGMSRRREPAKCHAVAFHERAVFLVQHALPGAHGKRRQEPAGATALWCRVDVVR